MRKIWVHIRSRVLAGIFFFIPLFFIIYILQRVWDKLTGFGSNLVKWFGLKPIFGHSSVAIATTFILICLFYIFGWLVKFKIMNRFIGWMEGALLHYIPGYSTFKLAIQEKMNPKEENYVSWHWPDKTELPEDTAHKT